MTLGATLLNNVGAPLGGILDGGILNNGIINAVRSPIDGILSGLPSDRILSNMYTSLVPSSIGDRLGGVPVIGNIGTGNLLDGDLLKLPAEFAQIREEFINAFAKATKIKVDAVREFLEICESLVGPGSKILAPEVSDVLVEMKIVQLFATLDNAVLESFRATLAELRALLPGTGKSKFMGVAKLGLLEDVRKTVFNGAFADGPLADLREKATLYVSDVFPMIGKLSDVDSILDSTAVKLGQALDIEIYPIDSLARLIDMKMRLITEAIDFKVDAITTLAEITKELVTSAVDVIPVVKDLVLLIPEVSIDILMELVSIAVQVGNGLIDLKLAAIEWVTRLPLEIVDSILEIKVDIFDDLVFAKLDILQGIWEQAQEMIKTYNNYTGFLGLTSEAFPLEFFGNISRDLVFRTALIRDGTDVPTDVATTEEITP